MAPLGRHLIAAVTVGASFALQAPQPAKPLTARNVLASPPVDAPWSPGSWRNFEATQIPKYDEEKLRAAEEELAASAPLVFAGEVRTLMSDLGRACKGDGFVIFGGDCAESFDEFSVDHVRDTFRVILQMALICTYGGGQPVIKIGRMAGDRKSVV